MKRPIFAADFWNKAINQNKVGTVLTSKHIGCWKATLSISGRHRIDLTFTDNKDDLITIIYGDDNIIEIYFGDQRSNYIGSMGSREQLVNFVFNRSDPEGFKLSSCSTSCYDTSPKSYSAK